MKKVRFLFALLMAIVMMAMSPMKMWAQSPEPSPVIEEADEEGYQRITCTSPKEGQGYGTIILPSGYNFDVVNAKFYKIRDLDYGKVYVTAVDNGMVTDGEHYIFKGTVTFTCLKDNLGQVVPQQFGAVSFTGTFEQKTLNPGYYFDIDSEKFVYTYDDVTVNPFHCYIEGPNAIQSVLSIVLDDDDDDDSGDDDEDSGDDGVASVTIGETTTGYDNIQDALTAALDEESATLTMLADVEINSSLSINKNGCNVTLDLNGHKISSSSNVIYLNAGKLTIEDNSIGQTGTMETTSGHVLNVIGGSITVHGGTFKTGSGQGLYISSNPDIIASVDGGRFINTSGSYAVYTLGVSALANGYSYYNANDKELSDKTNMPIYDLDGNYASDITVKPASVKATLTIGGETTNYYSFITAFNAAVNSESPVGMKLLADADLYAIHGMSQALSVNKSTCDITLDLNGYKVFQTQGDNVIYQTAGKLTIIDSSEGETGTMETTSSHALCVYGGSITIHGGNFKTGSGQGLYVNSSATALLDGGRFVGTSDNPNSSYGVYTVGTSTALANGYSYYNNDVELNSTTGVIKEDNGNPAQNVIVKPGTVKATLTIGGETTDYYTLSSAFGAALNSASPATLKVVVDADLRKVNNNGYPLMVNNANCDITLDLNGHKIYQSQGNPIIYSTTGKLTITDSSTDQTGVMETTNDHTLQIMGGTITIHGGTFMTGGNNKQALYIDNSDVVASVDGGRFVGTGSDTDNYAIQTKGESTALAEGYSYYNAISEKKLESTTGSILDEDGNYAKDVIVKSSVVPTFASLEELIAAGQDYDAVNVTIDDEVMIAMPNPDNPSVYFVILSYGNDGYIQLKAPTPDPALNWQSGGRVTGTLTNVRWNEDDKNLFGDDASFWSALNYTEPDLENIPTYSSIADLLADENLAINTNVTVTVSGTIATAEYLSDINAYQIMLDNGFAIGAIGCVTSDPGWVVGGTISGTLQNVTFMRNSEGGEEIVAVMSTAKNIFAPGAGLEYTAPAGGSECEHDFTSKTLTAEPDEHGLYAYACDREGCEGHSDYNVVKGNGEGNNIELIATTDSETGITTYSAESVIIEDGKPFYSPVEFTTRDVDMGRQFTQSIGDAVVPATIMLPFRMYAGEVSIVNPQGVRTGTKFYSFTSLDYNSYNDRWEANMDIVIDDLEAYTPYMVVLTDGEEIPFGNAPVTFTQTPAEMNNITSSDGEWNFVATNEAKVWTAADFGHGEAYYGFAAGNETTPEGKFVKVGTGASIDPLRAYIMKNVQTRGSASNAPSRALTASQLPSTIGVRLNETYATGIGTLNTETGEFTFDGWYDLQGRRISEPVKNGISVKNDKKILVK